MRVSRDGESVYVSDEYGPYVYEFDRGSGRRVKAFKIPDKFAVPHLSPQGNVEISGNTQGRVANKGMEGLAITPDGTTLYGAMQSPLLQDGGTNAAITRILEIDIKHGATREFAYALTNIGTQASPKYPTVSDIVAINDHEFLVDERDGKGLGDGSNASFKRLYKIDLSGAQDVSNLSGEANLAPAAVGKTLFLNVVTVLNAHGVTNDKIPAKLEGIAFGQDVVVGGATKHTLYVANDNDFLATVGGVDNSNKWFVFAFDDTDLPGLVPQQIDADDRCGDDPACCATGPGH